MIFRIVDPDTGEILDREFLVEKEAIRNFKIKAKRLNAVIRQIGEKMFGFKTEEEKFKLADYDRMKKELETTQQSLVNCEKSLQDWIDFANDLQEENRELFAENMQHHKNDIARQKMTNKNLTIAK